MADDAQVEDLLNQKTGRTKGASCATSSSSPVSTNA